TRRWPHPTRSHRGNAASGYQSPGDRMPDPARAEPGRADDAALPPDGDDALGNALGYGRVNLGLADGELGGVLLSVDLLGDLLVGAHQRLEIALRGVDDAQVGVGALHLLAPEPDVLHAGHDPREQQRPERLLHRGMLGELQA